MRKVKSINEDTEIGPISLEPVYPMISFREVDLPEIKDWKVGGEYEIIIKTKQKSIHEVSGGELEAHFEIIEVGII